MAQSGSTYALRAELKGHVDDVRGCLSCDLGIVTASRDKTARLWVEDGPTAYSCLNTFIGHKDYVGALLYIPPETSRDYPEAAVVTGSRDADVMVWDPATAQPLDTLTGHAYQVTALGVTLSGEIVSSSLDKTIKVWRGGKCIRTLEGHEGPVLSLAVLPSGDVLSGSGDTTIRQWAGATNRCVNVFRGHTDTVRGLAVLPDGSGFASVSHDCTGKVWTLAGQVVAELVGHSALIYAVAATKGGLLATGSEDNTARIWTINGSCLQVVEHVGCVWDVSFTGESDLVTACSDSVARVWTAREEGKGPAELQAAYQQTLEDIKAQRAAASNNSSGEGAGVEGGGSVPGLPPGVKVWDAVSLQQPGQTDGQVRVVKEATGAINAYSWDAQAWKWEMVGEVQEAPSGGAGGGTIKKGYKGKEYDFVIDVEMDDGQPRKLALNRGDNPYNIADKFIEEEGLPPHFRDQIVDFILRNTDAAPKTNLTNLPITGGFCDPFTGGSGAPSSSSGPPLPQWNAPSVPLSSLPVTGGFLDPLTGGGGVGGVTHGSGGQQQALVYLVFDSVPPMDKLAAKVRELSGQVGSASAALTEHESSVILQGLLHTAATAASPAQHAHKHTLTAGQLELLAKLLKWPSAQVFPILDVCRLLALHADTADCLLPLLTHDGPLAQALAHSAASGSPAATQQVALRVLCNLFRHPALRVWVAEQCGPQLDAFAGVGAASTATKAVRLSWATLLYNYCVFTSQQDADIIKEDTRLQLLSALVELSGSCPLDDADSLSRCLTALSVALSKDRDMAQVARDLGVNEVLQRLHSAPESTTPVFRPVLEAAVKVMNCVK